jgi:hypothetical protein
MLHTCATLQEQGLWDTQRCCQECHSGKPTLCMGLDTYRWINGEQALLCSSAYWCFWGLRHDPYATDVSTYLTDNGGISIPPMEE